jgi:UDP-N-acetylmuramoyl-L-alanyl-D-glutamate--2,6-diaminopimelate ligase
MARLSELMQGIKHRFLQGDPGAVVTGMEYDSRRIQPGYLFLCIPGFKTDGHNYISQALDRGAVAVMVEKPVAVPGNCPVVLVKSSRDAMPYLAARLFNFPSRELRVIGITGTNGKTTTTHLIKAILEEDGHKTGLMGTLNASIGDYEEKLANTTPESLDIQRFLRMVRERQGEYVVMEVSSHALDIGRVNQIDFAAAVFTNLTQDHLDYHRSLEKYREAKIKLFQGLVPSNDHFAVLNADDGSYQKFVEATQVETVSYGLQGTARVRVSESEITMTGSRFRVVFPDGELTIKLNLPGLFNIYNALAAIAFALREGVRPEVIQQALKKVKGVPGRFELVDAGQDFSVIVDYAHTPDGLENVLKTSRQIAQRRVITVFGCGGDRDRGKRPLMGKIAAQYSDFTIVTSDNPRSEDPLAIINEILPGLQTVENAHYAVVPDRREAIRHAIHLANKDDLIVIAGKGHEDYQLIKGKVYPFDDRKVARECIKEREMG